MTQERRKISDRVTDDEQATVEGQATDEAPSAEDRSTEQRALGWLAVAATLAIFWLAKPFASALLLGVLTGFTLDPLHRFIKRRTGRSSVASLVTVVVSALGLIIAVVGFVSLFVTRVVEFAAAARQQLQSDGPLRTWVSEVSQWLGRFGLSPTTLTTKLQEGAGAIASHFAELASAFAASTFSALLGLFFALLAMHLVLLHWPRMVEAMVKVSPLRPDHTKTLLQEFRRVGRITVFGTLMTGLTQGLLATLGYWICGVPQPIFFGIATALASLIPAVGTMLIWIPAGLYLILMGRAGFGTLELVWGALMVVGFSDYVIRPRLVGDESTALLVFIALFGGVEAFGLAGLILGPVVMALAVAVLQMYALGEKSVKFSE